MALLDDVIEAHGGLDRWNELERFTLHLSIGGKFLSQVGRTDSSGELIAEGSTRAPSVRFAGLMGADTCGSYHPDLVTAEALDGSVLRSWHNPRLAFTTATIASLTDELQLIFFCGFSIWNYLATPFLLSHPDVETEELSPWLESARPWRRLRALFPPHLVTHSTEQIFYFDDSGLQRRTDHQLGNTRIAHYSWAHQNFCDIILPTLRRSLLLNADGSVATKPVMLDIEIFDAFFE